MPPASSCMLIRSATNAASSSTLSPAMRAPNMPPPMRSDLTACSATSRTPPSPLAPNDSLRAGPATRLNGHTALSRCGRGASARGALKRVRSADLSAQIKALTILEIVLVRSRDRIVLPRRRVLIVFGADDLGGYGVAPAV